MVSGQGETVVPATAQEIWAALLDEHTLQTAIPGCRHIERVGEHAFKAQVMLGVGPVCGHFDANVCLRELDEPRSALLQGNLSGPLGAASGKGRLTLTPVKEGCRIAYCYDVHLSGRAAMIGGRMLNGAARQLVRLFFANFASRLGAPVVPPERFWRRRFHQLFGARR